MTTQEAINAILNGDKVRGIDWPVDAFIYLNPFKGIRNESENKPDAIVFIVNSKWEIFTEENQGERE